jgi:hypothetical protein
MHFYLHFREKPVQILEQRGGKSPGEACVVASET